MDRGRGCYIGCRRCLLPYLSPTRAGYPGCGVLVRGPRGYCVQHEAIARKRADERRPSASARGYDVDWRRRRAAYLADHTDCVMCGEPATVVDHRLPLAAGGADDETNWQPLCKLCHDSRKQSLDRRAVRAVAHRRG